MKSKKEQGGKQKSKTSMAREETNGSYRVEYSLVWEKLWK